MTQHITDIPKLPPRELSAHKGDFGKVCIVAGSLGFSGAAALAGKSALRSGSGLVRVAVPESILPIVAAIEPSYTTIALPQDKHARLSGAALAVIIAQVAENDIMAFGPGLGVTGAIRNILNTLIGHEGLRLVIDADGLNCLSLSGDWPGRRRASIILTPHPGEMQRLWQSLFREPVPPDRAGAAVSLAEHTRCTVVLKGAGTIVTDGKRLYTNRTGNPGMATAGSGDVLTGVISSLAGQGLDNFDAAVLGVYIHGLAGDIAADRIGQVSLTATDILDYLSDAFMRHGFLMKGQEDAE